MASVCYLIGFFATALATVACSSPGRTIRPVIHVREEDKYEAMKSAPSIVVAEIVSSKLISGARSVEMPREEGGTRTIPLYLAQISATVRLTLRGPEYKQIQFYCWVWASGMHGGPRFFRPRPGTNHILFLQNEGGYLHTVGDYPAYDLEVRSGWVPTFVSEWRSGQENGTDPFERIADFWLRTELKAMPVIEGNYWSPDMQDLMGLTSPFFIAKELDSYCRQFANPFGRFAACEATAREFPGRCEAYRIAEQLDSKGVAAGFLPKWLGLCEAQSAGAISFYRSLNWPLGPFYYGWRSTPERHRLAMRLYASAMDPEFHKAACESTATMSEARDIPECSSR